MPHAVELPPDTLRNGDTIIITTTLTINDPTDEVWPVVQDMRLESVEVIRSEDDP